ncbi:hypothetical protein K7X08_032384 [Anisodus acutangulus]|uniref:Uncharacterized protein n=1 Tax=Anisodus acutangulus TaxID=402998 RepID=A0A9Q1LXC1_9SOLA|nr:hypothetical protein K7X08_032384 [Anisodus acutangulus]
MGVQVCSPLHSVSTLPVFSSLSSFQFLAPLSPPLCEYSPVSFLEGYISRPSEISSRFSHDIRKSRLRWGKLQFVAGQVFKSVLSIHKTKRLLKPPISFSQNSHLNVNSFNFRTSRDSSCPNLLISLKSRVVPKKKSKGKQVVVKRFKGSSSSTTTVLESEDNFPNNSNTTTVLEPDPSLRPMSFSEANTRILEMMKQPLAIPTRRISFVVAPCHQKRMSRGKKSESDEVEELLRAAEDDVFLKLSVDSHMARGSSIDPDLDQRFQALRSKKNPTVSQQGMGLDKQPPSAMESDDLFTRFAALKSSLPAYSSASSSAVVENEEDDDDEVEKVIKWAIDAARLDPSPSSGTDDDNSTDEEEEDENSDDDSKRRQRKAKRK